MSMGIKNNARDVSGVRGKMVYISVIKGVRVFKRIPTN